VAWEGNSHPDVGRETKAGWLMYSIKSRKYKIYMRIKSDIVRRYRIAVYITTTAVCSVKNRGFRPAKT
jgi:hypothetical protein